MTRSRTIRDHPVNSATHIESLARSNTESAINTLVGLMTSPAVPPKDRIRCAELLLDRGWGKPEHHQLTDVQGTRLTKVVREIVHLDPVSREEFEQQDLSVDWRDVTSDRANGGGQT